MGTRITTTYVDITTAEEITKKHIEKGIYVKIKCHTTKKKVGNILEIHYLWECNKNNQLTLL